MLALAAARRVERRLEVPIVPVRSPNLDQDYFYHSLMHYGPPWPFVTYVRVQRVITNAFVHREKQRAEYGVTFARALSRSAGTNNNYPPVSPLVIHPSLRAHTPASARWFLAVSVLSAKRNFRRIFFPPRTRAERELRPRYERLNLTARFCRRINGRDRTELASHSHSAPCFVFPICAFVFHCYLRREIWCQIKIFYS